MKWQPEYDLAVGAARAAAELLLNTFTADAGVRSQVGKDIKTKADVEAEACILRLLAASGIPVLAEESAKDAVTMEGPRWLVDPLDGTMNFSRGFPMNAVSIGLWNGATPVMGVIYDLPRKALYSGCVGEGAWLDGKPMRVSTIAASGQAILATGFPTGRDYGADALKGFVGQVQSFKKIRMIGSAALSLAMVASGVFDAYYEEDIMIWDIAAGLALVAAAGGKIEFRPGSRTHAINATATNGLLTF